MGQSNGASKPSVAAVVSELKTKKSFDDYSEKGDFQATKERVLGKDIVKLVHTHQKSDKLNNYQYLDVRLGQLFRDHSLGERELPGWLAKLYENLQLEQGQSGLETGKLLKLIAEEIITYDQLRKVQNPPDSNGKITATEVVQLIDSLRLRKFNGESEHVKSMKIQVLHEKLDESLGKLKSLLTDRPEGWTETYEHEVAIVKIVINELEEFLKEVGDTLLKEPVFDWKVKAMTMFTLDAKKNVEHFKQSFKQWDSLAKININKAPKNDDIILVEHKKNVAPKIKDSKDEL